MEDGAKEVEKSGADMVQMGRSEAVVEYDAEYWHGQVNVPLGRSSYQKVISSF